MSGLPGRASDAGLSQADCHACGATPREWNSKDLCVRGHRVVCDACPDVMAGTEGLYCPLCLVELAEIAQMGMAV